MTTPSEAPVWRQVEWTFQIQHSLSNPYLEAQLWAEFRHESGVQLRRPLFWDGAETFKLRFASPLSEGLWNWHLATDSHFLDADLTHFRGSIAASPNRKPINRFERHGLLRMSAGKRSAIHHDGTPFLLVADTPWALLWRATIEECEVYAADRAAKGFNGALLMSLQPDRRAVGPRDRLHPEGFDVAFEDLPEGRLERLNPDYFRAADRLIEILLRYGITPVIQPVFHGFGWKGLEAAGRSVPAADYARYCRYLVARYGAGPAIYLVGGDGDGREPGVDEGGQEIEKWDAYQQPTGIHYGPNRDCFAWQERDWLDFQWCQTGHCGEHQPERVAWLRRNLPPKAVANGEPTYETRDHASGWWQGHEAWANLCAGGSMGVVYGAVGLWPWDRSDSAEDKPSWREALEFPGATYVGLLGKILDGLPSTDWEPNWTFTYSRRALAVEDRLFIVYLEKAAPFEILSQRVPIAYRIFDPATGAETGRGTLSGDGKSRWVHLEGEVPRVIIFS